MIENLLDHVKEPDSDFLKHPIVLSIHLHKEVTLKSNSDPSVTRQLKLYATFIKINSHYLPYFSPLSLFGLAFCFFPV